MGSDRDPGGKTVLDPSKLHSVFVSGGDQYTRSRLTQTVGKYEEFAVIGEAASGLESVEACVRYHPRVALMDIDDETLPLTGIATVRKVAALAPSTHVVALSARATASSVLSAIEAGAHGYVVKGSSPSEIHEAMVTVLGEAAQFAISCELMRRLAVDTTGRRCQVAAPRKMVEFTAREQEVVNWLCHGLSNRAIAERMFLSEGSVKAHLTSIMVKLGVSDRVQAVIRCHELSVVDLSLFQVGSTDPTSE